MKEQFEYSPEGVKAAVKYLKEVGEWESTKRGFSVDGWSIVMNANDVYQRLKSLEEIQKQGQDTGDYD